MNRKRKKQIVTILVILVVVVGGVYASRALQGPAPLDDFAKCLGEKGAIFYGAFWCPHCQNQKALFGRSQKHLPYEECSTPDTRGQLQICEDKEINSYPTWEFADGSRLTGEISLEELSVKTGCALP